MIDKEKVKKMSGKQIENKILEICREKADEPCITKQMFFDGIDEDDVAIIKGYVNLSNRGEIEWISYPLDFRPDCFRLKRWKLKNDRQRKSKGSYKITY